jgi:hypothetical protein
MRRIDRHAVVADHAAVASLVDGPDALMTVPAERAQRPEHKGVVVALMRRVVIGDRRWRCSALLLAQDAERLDRQLMLGPRAPGLEAIPITPVKRASWV